MSVFTRISKKGQKTSKENKSQSHGSIDTAKVFERIKLLNVQIKQVHDNRTKYLQAIENINAQINQLTGALEEYNQLIASSGYDLNEVYAKLQAEIDAEKQTNDGTTKNNVQA